MRAAKTLAFCGGEPYNRRMTFQKISALPAEIAVPAQENFGEARRVQSGSVSTCANAVRIESGGRFKRFSDGREYILIEKGNGQFKWRRGELPFQEGDVFYAEAPEEYDFYGSGVFLVLKA